MKISLIDIENYRGLKKCTFNPSEFVCIIGENNAGKSTILLATSLFFSGSSIKISDYFNPENPVLIEVTFSDIEEGDLNRIAEGHRQRIQSIIEDGKLTLTRRYRPDSRSELLFTKMAPKAPNFDLVSVTLSGARGVDVENRMVALFPNYRDRFKGVRTQKAAKEVVENIIEELPEDELEPKLSPLPTGIPESVNALLPEPIYIPAVKDLKDEVKTKESTSFGKLVSILLKSLEGTEAVQEILDSFERLHQMVNIYYEDDERIDGRIQKLRDIESSISQYLKENFPDVNVELEIPKPALRQIFSNARILIDDGVKDIADTKGDGLKRSLTFALLRAYVEHSRILKEEEKQRQIESENIKEGESELEINLQSYVFLFEEPELFLHPNAQKILFDALERLTQLGHHVFTTTHSPLFFSPKSTNTFARIKKVYPDSGVPYGELTSIDLLGNVNLRDAFQVICYENNAAAFFSKKVLLVEGVSDYIYVKEIAKRLNEKWSFDFNNIPIIQIDGKSNVKKFVDFYKIFEIEVFVLLDADAMIEGFEKFEVPDKVKQQRVKLFETLDEIAEQRIIKAVTTKAKIKELTRRFTWRERYENLKVLAKKVAEGIVLNEEEILSIEFLFSDETHNIRRQVFTDDTIQIEGKDNLICALMEYNIFVLSKGAIESYYPIGVSGADKPSKALSAIRIINEMEGDLNFLPKIKHEGVDKCELSLIFNRIFSADQNLAENPSLKPVGP